MAATGDPVQADERFARFLNYGIDIANGGTGRPAAKAAELQMLMRTKAPSYDLSDPNVAVTGG